MSANLNNSSGSTPNVDNQSSNNNSNNSGSSNNNSVDNIIQNFTTIKDSIESINSEVKTSIDNIGTTLISGIANPKKAIETLIADLKIIPIIIVGIIDDPAFTYQIKVLATNLANSLSQSIDIMTPEISDSISKMINEVTRSSLLSLLDAVGVIPGVGEILDVILTAHNILKIIFSFTNTGLELADISVTLLSNLIDFYKKESAEIQTIQGRIDNSINNFNKAESIGSNNNNNNNNNNQQQQQQSGGKKKKKKKQNSKKKKKKKKN